MTSTRTATLLACALTAGTLILLPNTAQARIAGCPTVANPYSGASRQLLGSRAGVTTYRYVKAGRTQLYLSTADVAHAVPRPILAPHVTDRVNPGPLITRSGAQAGVNGDFFRLSGDGSPIGPEAVGGAVVKATNVWTAALVTTRTGYLRYGQVRATVSLSHGHYVTLGTAKNTPGVAINGATVYTPRWGRTTPNAGAWHQWIIRGGRIVSTRGAATRLVIPTDGYVVEARGTTQNALVAQGWKTGVTVGQSAALKSTIPNASAAVGVGNVIVHNRLPYYGGCAADSPTGRTVVGLYPGGRKTALVAASNGRGLTLRETVAFMRAIGVSEAYMLDGGGSTTLATRTRQLTVPRYGVDRPVPNGFGFFVR